MNEWIVVLRKTPKENKKSIWNKRQRLKKKSRRAPPSTQPFLSSSFVLFPGLMISVPTTVTYVRK